MDRNNCAALIGVGQELSLSARRAWIEIRRTGQRQPAVKPSLSARRAWIEIKPAEQTETLKVVALRKESVDRNTTDMRQRLIEFRRSPQGERG